MDFQLTAEQSALRDLAARIARRFDEAYWQRVDADAAFPREAWDALVAHGIMGIPIPQAYGGSGLGLLDLTLACEALAEAGGGVECGGLPVSGPVFGGFLVLRHGTEAQRRAYLPGIIAGDVWGGAFSEAEGGSNLRSVRATAVREGESWVVNGQKSYISQLANAKHMVVLARTSPVSADRPHGGFSLIVTDLPHSGIQLSPFKKLGSRYMDTNNVFLDDVRVPADRVIGPVDGAWGPLFDILNPERIVLAAAAVGTGMYVLRRAVAFANERRVWNDEPIGSHQGIQFPLAQARAALAGARLKVYEAAWLFDQNAPECGVAAAMAKYLATHASLAAADQAIQTFGGAGYIVDSGIERHWRNLRLNRIAPVTDEMTLSFIARRDLGLPRSH
jgi:acyl-CoA dehydrogenase